MKHAGSAVTLAAITLCVSAALAPAAGAAGHAVKCPSFRAPFVNGYSNLYTHITAEGTTCETAKKVLIAWEHWTPSKRYSDGFECFPSPVPSKPDECTKGHERITTRLKQYAAKAP
ncbi:MAG: hypothetical protein ACRDJX_05390 [Solirubrobacteraceae bacterium]